MIMSKLQKEQDRWYSAQSKHFHNTRKKHWPEVDHVTVSLKEWSESYTKDDMSVTDLWCWSWRLSAYIRDVFPSCTYTWVDSAQWMVEQAREVYATEKFIHDDMMHYCSLLPQESNDCIIALASFQHIQWHNNHLLLLSHIYKALTWWWRCYLINRSFSDWFLKKYRKNTWKAIVRSLYASWRAWNDIVIPWKDKSFHTNGISFDRMYHIFTLPELRNLCTTAWFTIKESCFISQQWEKTTDWHTARNSYMVLEKSVA